MSTYSLPEREGRAGAFGRGATAVHLPLLGVSDVSLHREVEGVRVVEHPQKSLEQWGKG